MTLVQLQVFLAVVEAKSFTRAAETLNMTQSAVSQTIGSLESELGVTLLNRSRSGVTSTHIGERVLGHVREILYRSRCMVEETNAAKGLEVGSLRIGTIPSMSAKLLPGILAAFTRQFPGIKIILFEGTYDEVKEWTLDGVIDLGILTMHEGDPIATFPLVEDRLTVFFPHDHALAKAQHVSIQDIAQLPFIMPKADSDGFIHEVFEHAGVEPNVQFAVQDTATILSMVQEGIGITLLPQMAIPSSLPNVESVSLQPPIARKIGIGVKTPQHFTPAVAEFILAAQAYVQTLGGQDAGSP